VTFKLVVYCLKHYANACPYVSLLQNGYSDGLCDGLPGFDSRQVQDVLVSTLFMEPIWFAIQWVRDGCIPGVERPEPDVNRSPSVAEVMDGEAMRRLSHSSSWHTAEILSTAIVSLTRRNHCFTPVAVD
jgi:hypothetical protein